MWLIAQRILPVLVSARGTGEAAGWSGGVHAMTLRTLEQVPNGAYYPVRYPAGNDVNTTLGSLDVCHKSQNVMVLTYFGG